MAVFRINSRLCSVLGLMLAGLALSCAGSKEIADDGTAGRIPHLRLLIAPIETDERNRMTTESLASRYADGLRSSVGQVLSLWENADPVFRRDVDALHTQIGKAHLLQGTVNADLLTSPRLNVNADLVAVFEVVGYGQRWKHYDPLKKDWPIDIIRLEPELGKITNVELRATFYSPASGNLIGDAWGRSDTDRTSRGKTFDIVEVEAVDRLVASSRGVIRNWWDELPGQTPAPETDVAGGDIRTSTVTIEPITADGNIHPATD